MGPEGSSSITPTPCRNNNVFPAQGRYFAASSEPRQTAMFEPLPELGERPIQVGCPFEWVRLPPAKAVVIQSRCAGLHSRTRQSGRDAGAGSHWPDDSPLDRSPGGGLPAEWVLLNFHRHRDGGS
jgi:hypothetical protein